MTDLPDDQEPQRIPTRLVKPGFTPHEPDEPEDAADLEEQAEIEGPEFLPADDSDEPPEGEPENLPAVPEDDAALEGVVVDGDPRSAMATVAADPRTRAVARQIAYVAFGAGTASRKWWHASTTARHQQMMDAAIAVGDHKTALEWDARAQLFRRERHTRTFEWIELPAKIIGKAPRIIFGAAAVLLVIGTCMAVAQHNIRRLLVPFKTAADLVTLAVDIVNAAWLPALILIPAVGLAVLWHVGRTHASLPAWLATSGDGMDMPIDESTIAQALDNLRIPQISNYLKQGHPLQFIVPCRQEGRGTGFEVRLPGIPAEMVAKRRAQVAAGLYRRAQEVWITTGSEAGIMVGWAADKGALAEGAGPYPLLTSGLTNVFDGAPYGKTLRGDPLVAPIMGRNSIIAGQPEQGKSAGARTLMLGAALDPIAELVIFVPDSNFDFEAFRRRCSVYVMGAEDEKIEQICLTLEALLEEIQWRGDLLVKYQQEQVTRKLAAAGVGLHPKLVLLEEAHRAFGHPDFGSRISVAWETGVRLCRKRGIHMIASTQATTGPSGIPPGVTINCSNGIAYALARWQENDAVLGQGAYSAGHRATDLIPGEDRGNAVVKGFTGERSVVAQAYYVSPSKGRDQVTPIIDRAMAAIAKRGHGVPGAETAPALPAEARDLLEDLDEVAGAERVRLADLPALLRDLAPDWAPYRSLNGKQLEQRLAGEGVRITRTNNVPRLDPLDLRFVIMQRATEDLDGE